MNGSVRGTTSLSVVASVLNESSPNDAGNEQAVIAPEGFREGGVHSIVK
ncbi:MAG: hypothetical protein OXI57_04220 [Rhodospirillales bacterium]|nr:hypothetical protein [Rhodospirillales bacterium]